MRFVIVGPGALGSLFGATLAKRGHAVSLLGRQTPHLEALRDQGLRLEARDGTVEHLTVSATHDSAIVSDADALIVLVKSVDTVPALNAIRPYVSPNQIVLTMQNGLGTVERIRSALGPGPRILVGVTSQAATRLGPGSVRHAGEGPTLIGYLDERDAPIAAELASLFTAAGLAATSVPDIDRWVWQKLAVNAAINGLTALGNFPNGTIATTPSLLDAAEIIAEEVASVAREIGIELGGMRRAIVETANATKGNRSSMLQDLDAGRPTEVAAIHEAVLAAADEAGIATPATRVVAALIRAKERAVSGAESVDGD
jgi:2-dehydropantoate 2-reductase